MNIRPYQPADEAAVIALWERCELTRPWNDPRKDIQRKLAIQAELFVVGELNGQIVATAMAGFDGHRGWINYLAVSPDRQRQGLGRQLVAHIERALQAMGCPKLNLQIRAGNAQVIAFYQALGYGQDELISMGKRLISDQP
ncbi:MAG: GNAT family acetyltransferase [Burkholderiales bacterium]|nr:GNAT family acetyltransferase [Burkholderiales bacterium]